MSASKVLPAAVLIFAAGCGINQEHYDSARQARAFGAATRGMLPECVPDSARNVHMVVDHNTGGVWVWCDLDPGAQSELKTNVRRVGWAEAAANTSPPPFSFNFPDWNPILGGRMTYTPPAGPLYFVFGEWHGIANPNGRCWITLTSRPKARSLGDHMLHRIPTLMGRMVMRRPGADA